MRKQKGNTEISTPVTCEDHEILLTEPSINNISFKYDESPEVPFETTIGSLPSEKDAFPKTKVSHSRSRSMDLQAQRLNPKRTTYSRCFSGKFHREDDEPELSYAA